MSDCARCDDLAEKVRERDARIEQLCTELRRSEDAKFDYLVALHDRERRTENPR